MADNITWRATALAFAVPDDINRLIKAEIGLTDGYLSFIALTAAGECRRVEISVLSESEDGTRHRKVTGKLIRGLDEETAKHVIAKINTALIGSGTILKEARRETAEGKTIIVFKRLDPYALTPPDDQTPMLLTRNQNTEVTAVRLRYADIMMTRRRSDTPIG